MRMLWAVGPTPHTAVDAPGITFDPNVAAVDLATLVPLGRNWTDADLARWTPADWATYTNNCALGRISTYPVVGPEFDGVLHTDTEFIHPTGENGYRFNSLLALAMRRACPHAKILCYGFPVQRNAEWDTLPHAADVRDSHDLYMAHYRLWDGLICSCYVGSGDTTPLPVLERRLRLNTLEACRLGAHLGKPVYAWIMCRQAGVPYTVAPLADAVARVVVRVPLDYGCTLVLNDWTMGWEAAFVAAVNAVSPAWAQEGTAA